MEVCCTGCAAWILNDVFADVDNNTQTAIAHLEEDVIPACLACPEIVQKEVMDSTKEIERKRERESNKS